MKKDYLFQIIMRLFPDYYEIIYEEKTLFSQNKKIKFEVILKSYNFITKLIYS